MKYIAFSRHFPAGHPRKGDPTYFVEKIWKSIWDNHKGSNNPLHPYWELYDDAFPVQYDVMENIHRHEPKLHTIRAGARFSPGETVSLRVWQLPGGMYAKGNKQIEFAQVEVKKTWAIEINNRFGAASFEVVINGVVFAQLHYGNDKDLNRDGLIMLAKNDGLEIDDFVSWFNMHPKKKGEVFRGQIVSWGDGVEYKL